MEFYTSIAPFYDYIFPGNQASVDFVRSRFPQDAGGLLDMGCSTGSLAISLSGKVPSITGIDLDDDMIVLAKEKSRSLQDPPNFYTMNMLDIEKRFGKDQYDAVTCFGNTLVHLPDLASLRNLFDQVFHVLKHAGVFMVQIVNYSNVSMIEMSRLPTIDNKYIRFERSYLIRKDGRFDFSTELTDKGTGRIIRHVIPVFPLEKDDLEELAKMAGFSDLQFFGNFNGLAFTQVSPALIAVFRKN